LLLFGRGGRSQEAWNRRVALAERVGACVMTDLRTASVFPTRHPAHVAAPMANASAVDRGLIAEADLVLAFEWCDLGGTLAPPGTQAPSCPVISVSLDEALHNGAHMNYLALPPVDLRVAAAPDAVVAQLVEALRGSVRPAWRTRPAPRPVDRSRLSVRLLGAVLREAISQPDKIALASVCRGWPCDLWPFDHPWSYHGKDGGGGIGASPSLAVGVALALHTQGRHTIAAMGDGDFIMGGHALWTAVHHRIPMLVLVNNNRSYFNDELHQEAVARRRGRPVENRWIGQSLTDPVMDLAGFARMQGAVGIGPVTSPDDARAAIDEGLAALNAGRVCVIDFHVDPGDERTVHATGTRVA
jgi:thiamine pyrophosphate-dependent acetolactate synthase large subunit-like protein